MSNINLNASHFDVCEKWPGFWSRGDLIDSLIYCKMFPDRHYIDDNNIAYVFGISHRGSAGMTGQDIGKLYKFFLDNPTFQSNPIQYWLNISNEKMEQLDDRRLVDVAILRFGRMSLPTAR